MEATPDVFDVVIDLGVGRSGPGGGGDAGPGWTAREPRRRGRGIGDLHLNRGAQPFREILGYTNLAVPWSQLTDAMGEILRRTAAGQLKFEPEIVPMTGVDQGWQRQAERRNTSRVVVDLRT